MSGELMYLVKQSASVSANKKYDILDVVLLLHFMKEFGHLSKFTIYCNVSSFRLVPFSLVSAVSFRFGLPRFYEEIKSVVKAFEESVRVNLSKDKVSVENVHAVRFFFLVSGLVFVLLSFSVNGNIVF